jgi:hypothetical protein
MRIILGIYIYIYIHYTTLHYVTLGYITLHFITLHCITFHYITLHYITYIHTDIQTYTYTYYMYIIYIYNGVYPPVSSNAANWEIPELAMELSCWKNHRTKWWSFQQALFDDTGGYT